MKTKTSRASFFLILLYVLSNMFSVSALAAEYKLPALMGKAANEDVGNLSSGNPDASSKDTSSNRWFSNWAVPFLNRAVSYGIQPEFLTRMDVSRPANRAQIAEMTVMLYEGVSGITVDIPLGNPFTDTENQFVLKAYNMDLIHGTSNETYSPDTTVTRQQAATIIARTFEALGGNTGSGNAATYSDESLIADWAKDAVRIMSLTGIIEGVGEQRFAPLQEVSVEQFETMCVRTYEKLKES